MQLLVICNPENRRIDFLQKAATPCGWTIKTVAYANLLAGQVNLAAESRGCVAARIDSPSENFIVERMLLARGAKATAEFGYPTLEAETALGLEYELGRIHFPWQYYLGFKSLLELVDECLPGISWMNSPRAVATMFDKLATMDCFQAHGISIPKQLGLVSSFEQLRDLLILTEQKRVFIKLTTGSSASCAVAIVRHGERFRATTTVELVNSASGTIKLYNSLKLHHLSDTKEIAQLIDTLVAHRIFAEVWLPKAAHDHRSTFDVRAVVIDGTATHFVPRVSASPMTNLHLGNRRGDWELIKKRLGTNLARLQQSCANAARALPESYYCGLDVVIDPSMSRFHLLEANAFGDLLPGIVDANDHDTYTTQFKHLQQHVR